MRNYEIDTLSVFEAGGHTEKQAMDSKTSLPNIPSSPFT